MKVLLVHNYYGSSAPSGENQVLESEKRLLELQGHEVDGYFRHSDKLRAMGTLGEILGGLSIPYNPITVYSIRRRLGAFRPEIVHVHNTFPLISNSVFQGTGLRAAKVLTLHNYRLFCPAAIPMRDGSPCIDCLDRRSVGSSLRHGCYRNSRLATVPVAAGVALHRFMKTWTRSVDAFVALTDFQRAKMVEAGLPESLVHVKPNYFPGNPIVLPQGERPERVLFAGRLTAEKGVRALVRAWIMWGESAPELFIAGEGDLRQELERTASASPRTPIRFLGQLSGDDAREEIARARLLLLPSEWFEGFPMVLLEAFAHGTPAAVSKIGSLPEVVKDGQNGLLFEPGDPESLLATVRSAWESDAGLNRLAEGARRSFDELYNEDANYSILASIYERAQEVYMRRKTLR